MIFNEKCLNKFAKISEDEQPLIEALAAIGIKVDSLMYVKTESNQRMWMCPVKDCRKLYAKQSALKVHILSHYGLRPFKVLLFNKERKY